MSAPNPALESLDVMVGTWDSNGYEPGPEGGGTGRVAFGWMDGGIYFTQHADVDHIGQRIPVVGCVEYDESNRVPGSHSFSNYGPVPFGGAVEYEWEKSDDPLSWGEYEATTTRARIRLPERTRNERRF